MLFILTADLKAEYNDQSEDEKEDSDSTEELRVPSRQLARHVEGKVCTLHMVGEVMSGLHVRRLLTQISVNTREHSSVRVANEPKGS